MGRRIPWALAAAAVIGCSSSHSYVPSPILQEMGDELYQAGNFLDASQKFSKLLERSPGDFKALVGIANCYREVGTDHYLRATELERMGNLDGARKEAELAHQFHTNSLAAFTRALQARRDAPQALYGMGLLHYHRASGAYRLFAENEGAEIERCARQAAACFEKVYEKDPELASVRRYLGLSWLRAMEFPRAIPHLQAHLAYVIQLRMQLQSWVPKTPEDAERRRRGLSDLEAEQSDLEKLLEFCRTPPTPDGTGVAPASFQRLMGESIRLRPLPDGSAPASPESSPAESPPR